MQTVHNYFLTATYPYDLSDLLNTVLSRFSGKIQDLSFGELHNGLTLTLPDWISWTSVTHPETVITEASILVTYVALGAAVLTAIFTEIYKAFK